MYVLILHTMAYASCFIDLASSSKEKTCMHVINKKLNYIFFPFFKYRGLESTNSNNHKATKLLKKKKEQRTKKGRGIKVGLITKLIRRTCLLLFFEALITIDLL
jgi:hypothetical protein